ncbi:hypothetical protein Q5752_000699 [Cryptotrichosporon argae]
MPSKPSRNAPSDPPTHPSGFHTIKDDLANNPGKPIPLWMFAEPSDAERAELNQISMFGLDPEANWVSNADAHVQGSVALSGVNNPVKSSPEQRVCAGPRIDKATGRAPVEPTPAEANSGSTTSSFPLSTSSIVEAHFPAVATPDSPCKANQASTDHSSLEYVSIPLPPSSATGPYSSSKRPTALSEKEAHALARPKSESDSEDELPVRPVAGGRAFVKRSVGGSRTSLGARRREGSELFYETTPAQGTNKAVLSQAGGSGDSAKISTGLTEEEDEAGEPEEEAYDEQPLNADGVSLGEGPSQHDFASDDSGLSDYEREERARTRRARGSTHAKHVPGPPVAADVLSSLEGSQHSAFGLLADSPVKTPTPPLLPTAPPVLPTRKTRPAHSADVVTQATPPTPPGSYAHPQPTQKEAQGSAEHDSGEGSLPTPVSMSPRATSYFDPQGSPDLADGDADRHEAVIAATSHPAATVSSEGAQQTRPASPARQPRSSQDAADEPRKRARRNASPLKPILDRAWGKRDAVRPSESPPRAEGVVSAFFGRRAKGKQREVLESEVAMADVIDSLRDEAPGRGVDDRMDVDPTGTDGTPERPRTKPEPPSTARRKTIVAAAQQRGDVREASAAYASATPGPSRAKQEPRSASRQKEEPGPAPVRGTPTARGVQGEATDTRAVRVTAGDSHIANAAAASDRASPSKGIWLSRPPLDLALEDAVDPIFLRDIMRKAAEAQVARQRDRR